MICYSVFIKSGKLAIRKIFLSSLFCIVWAEGALDIFTVCPDVDLLCWLCIYSNIFVIGRQKSLKVHVALISFFGFETYRLIARQLEPGRMYTNLSYIICIARVFDDHRSCQKLINYITNIKAKSKRYIGSRKFQS